MSGIRLTHNEDGRLRRLHFFEQHGARLAPAVHEELIRLRARDYRGAVREPADGRVLWGV